MKRQDCNDPFLRGYIDCALFTTDPSPPGGCDYIESGRADEMWEFIPQDFINQARIDCERFETENADALQHAGTFEQNGHDFWYTRNRHGCGFWDRGYDNEIDDKLTDAAHAFGEIDLMLNLDHFNPDAGDAELIQFARAVLQILNRDEDWSADTFDSIAQAAEDCNVTNETERS